MLNYFLSLLRHSFLRLFLPVVDIWRGSVTGKNQSNWPHSSSNFIPLLFSKWKANNIPRQKSDLNQYAERLLTGVVYRTSTDIIAFTPQRNIIPHKKCTRTEPLRLYRCLTNVITLRVYWNKFFLRVQTVIMHNLLSFCQADIIIV